MLLLAASAAAVLMADPMPLDMPRAEAYLVREGGRRYLEDRFDRLDLWSSRAVDGRWLDDEGRVFVCSALRECPPQEISESSVSTRAEYVRSAGPVKRDDLERRRRAVELLSPVEVAEEPERPRQRPRGFRDVEYWQGTNETAVVCAFLPEKEDWAWWSPTSSTASAWSSAAPSPPRGTAPTCWSCPPPPSPGPWR